MEVIHEILSLIISIAVLVFEITGVVLIIFTGVQGIYNLIKKKKTPCNWLKTLLLALTFLLLGEVLETVLIQTFNQLFIVAGIFALRALIVIFINWEMKQEH
ncbi:MAG: DUF1622 domain-containing protein [Clostridiales bacterium]|nr:DUF1622 domain-containing protein [Clostridiales bacterium]